MFSMMTTSPTVASLQALRKQPLERLDPVVAELVAAEAERRRSGLNLVASENDAWPAVVAILSTAPHDKYSEGYPGKRYHGGCEVVDEIEELAVDRAEALFGADHANVQPHAGAPANMAVYLACLEAGDTILSMRLDHGGHLSHGLGVNFSGRLYNAVHYGVRESDGLIDLDEVRALARQHRPRLIICGGSSYPRVIDTAGLREIADESGALLHCDMAHIGGLVAAGVCPSPVPHCDFVTTTTNKTLGGPRGGLVLCRKEHAAAVDKAVFPGMQGGALNNAIAAKAAVFGIAATVAFRSYAELVCTNARSLGETLAENGHALLTGGTDTHMVVVDLRETPLDGAEAERRLAEIGIVANRNVVPFDTRPPMVTSGLRFGTAAGTMRGLEHEDFAEVGGIVAAALAEEPAHALRHRVDALLER
jgi:glycine hydroxymethyltransferase